LAEKVMGATPSSPSTGITSSSEEALWDATVSERFNNVGGSVPLIIGEYIKEMTAEGKTPVAWNFSTMPSENWKNGVGSALTAYAAGTGSWDDVVTAFVDGWASEAALNAAA
jgi:hypothetical protein